MTAAELHAEAATIAQAVALAESATEQVRLRGLVNAFDYNAPLPDLHIRESRSWEPAARHYRDIEPTERES